MSNPSPAYVGRVASVFQSSQGNMQSVITALLTDTEAQSEGSGKLAEPILYATGLLRALNATITAPDALTAQATAMGQTPLSPSSVFSYFSPFYTIPDYAADGGARIPGPECGHGAGACEFRIPRGHQRNHHRDHR